MFKILSAARPIGSSDRVFFKLVLLWSVLMAGADEQLIYAAEKGDLQMARCAIEAGARVDASKEYNKRTPLFLASAHGHTDIVRLLIDQGADVSLKDVNGDNPLHDCGNIDIAGILIDRGVKIDVQNYVGITPLISMAVSYTHLTLPTNREV